MSIKIGEIYKNYSNDLYVVIGIATNTENNEDLIIYTSYPNQGKLLTKSMYVFLDEFRRK